MKIGTKVLIGYLGLGLFVIIASFLGVLPIERNLKEIGGFHSAALNSIHSINSKLNGAVEESFAYVVDGKWFWK